MEIKQLAHRAMEIREKYGELEKKKCGKLWDRSQIAQGFAGDVGELMKIIMAKEGLRDMEDVDKKLAHELSDCLWSVLVLAEKYEINIEKAFFKTMDELEERIKNNHG